MEYGRKEGKCVLLHLIRQRLIVLPGCLNKDNEIVQVFCFFLCVCVKALARGPASHRFIWLLTRDSATERLPEVSHFPPAEHCVLLMLLLLQPLLLWCSGRSQPSCLGHALLSLARTESFAEARVAACAVPSAASFRQPEEQRLVNPCSPRQHLYLPTHVLSIPVGVTPRAHNRNLFYYTSVNKTLRNAQTDALK